MRMTHASVWRNRPSEKTVFVSDYLKDALPVLKKNRKIKKILDVACGNGLGVSVPLMKLGYNVYAFDHTKAAIQALKKNAAGFKVNVRKADMYKRFPYPSSFFDATFCFQAIYHGTLQDVRNALSEIKRVTKRGGYAFVSFLPYENLHYDKRRKLLYSFVRKGRGIGRGYWRMSRNEPRVFYTTRSNFEQGIPHCHLHRPEVLDLMNSFFSEVTIKRVARKQDTKWFFWLAHGRVRK